MQSLKNFLAAREMPDQLTVFTILLMVSTVHDMGDPWWTWGGMAAPIFIQGLLLAAITLIGLNVKPATLCLFSAISAIYFLVTAFPELGNHVILLTYCNLVILIVVPILLLRDHKTGDGDELFTLMKPVIRLILVVTLFVAGFHKFNTDFLNPEVSCVAYILSLLEGRALRTVYGIPFWIIAGPLVLGIAFWIFRLMPWKKFALSRSGVAFITLMVLLLAVGAVLSGGGLGLTIVGAGAVLTVLWQMIEGPLLFVRRLQAPILLISLAILGTIAVSGIPMFPAMFAPLLFSFVPNHVFTWWRDKSLLEIGIYKVHSIYVFFFLVVLGGLILIVNESLEPSREARMFAIAVSQALYLGGVALILFPLFREFLSDARKWRWEGVKVWDSPTPRMFIVFPLIWLLWGMTPYLGLRTTGNLSMFSNVKTEGTHSNHLLLGSNPFKIWNYQEDRVMILHLDEGAPEVGYRFAAPTGFSVPASEFKKAVIMWREAGSKVGMTYEYQSDTVRTDDIVNDKNWIDSQRSWETFWLDFRPVQESGPNVCRW